MIFRIQKVKLLLCCFLFLSFFPPYFQDRTLLCSPSFLQTLDPSSSWDIGMCYQANQTLDSFSPVIDPNASVFMSKYPLRESLVFFISCVVWGFFCEEKSGSFYVSKECACAVKYRQNLYFYYLDLSRTKTNHLVQHGTASVLSSWAMFSPQVQFNLQLTKPSTSLDTQPGTTVSRPCSTEKEK